MSYSSILSSRTLAAIAAVSLTIAFAGVASAQEASGVGRALIEGFTFYALFICSNKN